MKVIKRSGTEVKFDKRKIVAAIEGANDSVEEQYRLSTEEILSITEKVVDKCNSYKRAVHVEEIQDLVENELMDAKHFQVARKYITYRYSRALVRKANTTDNQILSLIELDNEEVKQENSNKNPMIVSTQRDYMAGEVSKDISKRFLLDQDVIDAHNQGILHFHDMDYFAQHIHNCCLVNLEDMLQNGTVISGTLIEKPKSFYTACNIATQIIAQVASSQYGGQTITLSHLAPFVDVSRQKIRKDVIAELEQYHENFNLNDDKYQKMVDGITEKRLAREIKHGV